MLHPSPLRALSHSSCRTSSSKFIYFLFSILRRTNHYKIKHVHCHEILVQNRRARRGEIKGKMKIGCSYQWNWHIVKSVEIWQKKIEFKLKVDVFLFVSKWKISAAYKFIWRGLPSSMDYFVDDRIERRWVKKMLPLLPPSSSSFQVFDIS